MISDLPRDLAEEVLSRLPVTSLRGVRFTCKKWNSLTKNQSLQIGNKQRTEFQVVMLLEDRAYRQTPLFDRYALGYEKKNKNKYSLRGGYKVLRFMDDYDSSVKKRITEFEIYSLESDSWKVVHVNPDWDIEWFQRGVSLKGNTYWYAQEKVPVVAQGRARDISDQRDFLLCFQCFDFTTERFGPRLPLPFHSFGEIVTLSSVREGQLAVLFQKIGGLALYTLKIWISSKIDINPFTGFQFLKIGGSFFVDEKKKVAVVLDVDRGRSCLTRNTAYMIGENDYFKKVDLGHCWPLVCSYVPISVQIKQASPPSNKKNTP
ncbi:unnamed protein product [Microthlaspi erraticum]|uniref:F-box domain-containing protein n=1 Tax=Microthlaspi erraticum TaxID=1685480 RepID=A0A6D2HM26_9BRAS|nr:unnamed protein product [Microthlaspi erraticum]